MSKELYTVLIDKCTDNQVITFENEDADGLFAFNQVNHLMTRTAGIGGLERREYIYNPRVATKESEVYGLIMAWEREMKNQEKALPAHYREMGLLNPHLKTSIMKKIAFGNIKEYIKTNEAIKEYEELREEVLTMALFSQTECNKLKPQGPTPMDLSAVMAKIKEELNTEPHGHEQTGSACQHGHTPGVNVNFGGSAEKMNEVDKMVQDLLALVKGQGKGRETRACHNCGKAGHLAKDCWNKPGVKGFKGGGKGNFGKGDFGKGEGKGGGKGKGGPKGGCWNCGGDHFAANCPKGRRVNGVEDEGSTNEGQEVNLGGSGDQDEWNQLSGGYIVDWGPGWKTVNPKGKTTTMPQQEICQVNCEGEWEKITFVGDSGAVDHVLTKKAAEAFPVKQTAMSKAGVGFTAANGTPIRNYGARELKGVTVNNNAFSMTGQVTDVNKNLASFPKMVEQGLDIVLSKSKGSYISDEKTGLKIPVRLKPKGTPEFDLYVKRAGKNKYSVLSVNEEEVNLAKAQGFQRLEELI